MLNQFGASGNLVDLIYNFQEPGERSLVTSAQHNIGPNTWFDVELVRSSNNSTVKVNGVPIVQKWTTGQFGPGRVGVISHWARGRFDNLSVKPLLVRDR